MINVLSFIYLFNFNIHSFININELSYRIESCVITAFNTLNLNCKMASGEKYGSINMSRCSYILFKCLNVRRIFSYWPFEYYVNDLFKWWPVRSTCCIIWPKKWHSKAPLKRLNLQYICQNVLFAQQGVNRLPLTYNSSTRLAPIYQPPLCEPKFKFPFTEWGDQYIYG
jgi:hypothetical protein